MIVFRMLCVALRIAWPDVLTPWRSPLVRWRLETYGVMDEQGHLLHADEITFPRYLQFMTRQGAALTRFLQWAARL